MGGANRHPRPRRLYGWSLLRGTHMVGQARLVALLVETRVGGRQAWVQWTASAGRKEGRALL